MKVLAAVFLCAFVAAAQAASLSQEQKAKLAKYYEECVASTGVDKELVAGAREGDFADDQKLKEFFNCMFKKAGFQNEAGEIQVDVIKAKMPQDVNEDDVEKVIAACKDKKGSTPAETAYLVYKCYWEMSPEHISLA